MARWAEEAFDLVERGIGRRRVNVPTRTADEPRSDLGMLLGDVPVDDQMDSWAGTLVSVWAQEGEELLFMTAGLHWVMTALSSTMRAANQGSGAIALVFVGDALDVAHPPGSRV